MFYVEAKVKIYRTTLVFALSLSVIFSAQKLNDRSTYQSGASCPLTRLSIIYIQYSDCNVQLRIYTDCINTCIKILIRIVVIRLLGVGDLRWYGNSN